MYLGLQSLIVYNRLEESGLNLKIRDQPIQEDENEAQQAINEMANTLRLVCYFQNAILLYSADPSYSKLNSRGLDAMLVRLEDGETSETPSSYLILLCRDRKFPALAPVWSLQFQFLRCHQANILHDPVVPRKNMLYQTLLQFALVIHCTVCLARFPTPTYMSPV